MKKNLLIQVKIFFLYIYIYVYKDYGHVKYMLNEKSVVSSKTLGQSCKRIARIRFTITSVFAFKVSIKRYEIDCIYLCIQLAKNSK